MRQPKRVLLAVLSTVTALSAVAAVGSAVPAAAANTSPIVVGGVWTQASYAGADAGAKAVFDQFNAAGGLDGRKIKFIGMEEDDASTATDITATKTLVNDGVMAVLPVMTQAWAGGAILAKANIPYFGWGISASWSGSNNGFSFIGAAQSPTVKVTTSTAYAECISFPGGNCRGKTVALVGINNTAAITAVNDQKKEWTDLGAKVVLSLTSIPSPPATVSDYSPYVNQILVANHGKQPDAVDTLLPPLTDIGLYQALSHAGLSGHYFAKSMYDPRVASIAKGAYVELQQAPWQQKTSAVAAMIKTVGTISPAPLQSEPTEAGYISAKLFIAALKKVGPSVTGAKLISTLNKGFSFSIPGLLESISFPSGHNQGQAGGAVVYGTGSAYTVTVPLLSPPKVLFPG